MKKMLMLLIMSLFGVYVSAQLMQVASFQRLPMDLTARINPRVDLNGKYCAVVKIKSIEKELSFNGNIIGSPEFKKGEIWLYLVSGSRILTITNDKVGTIKYEIPERLEEQVAYELDLRFVENKRERLRTIVAAGVDILGFKGERPGNMVGYSVMVGLVRKFGGYAKMRLTTERFDVEGSVEGKDLVGVNYINGVERLAILGGGLYRLSGSLYLMAGVGYGYVNVIGEATRVNQSGNFDYINKKLSAYSSSGVEAEVGGALRLVNIVLTANVHTNGFKYFGYGFGLGVMF